ncbi:hypothetical protein [Mesorhizobium sp.]|uniref:hypothetical protein n=1 Tax=Mesorhizobium sp. TaxID=1871066 RepID=UPI0025E59AEB|nr:hypothetical protein [Mesorhizobium sp.]
MGIEAQHAAVARFAEAEGMIILQEFTEIETGKGADALDRRPQLTARPCPPDKMPGRRPSPIASLVMSPPLPD